MPETPSNTCCGVDELGYRVDEEPPAIVGNGDSSGGTDPHAGGGDLSPEGLMASPIAAWGKDIPLEPGQTLSNLVPWDAADVEGPAQENARYGMLVIEAPRDYAPGSTVGIEDLLNEPVVKAIPVEEFTHRYNGEVRGYEFNVGRGSSVDDSLTLASVFDWCLNKGGAGVNKVIIRARNPSDSIYLNRLVTLYASNTHVEFRSPVIFGASGGLRIMGDQPEVLRNGKTFKAKLRSQAAAGATVLELSSNSPTTNMQATDFQAGDVIVLRGQNDVYGKAMTKQVVHVASIDAGLNNLNLSEELEYTFEVTYPLSDWLPDLTTGTTIALAAYAALTVNAAAGDMMVRVNRSQLESSGIVAGSMVLVSTNETEYDINSHAHSSGGTPYKNAARLEWKKVISTTVFDADETDVLLDSPLIDAYATLKYAGITLIAPVVNSYFAGVRASYNADQGSRNTHGIQVGYSYKSGVRDCEVDGTGGAKGNSFRLSNSIDCTAVQCRASNPKFFGSGEGYGFTSYYSERCKFINCTAEGCRHNYLVQKANGSQFLYCDSINDFISGFDVHGVRSFNTHFLGCRGFGGPGLAADATHKSIFRVGNTSHACGDFNTVMEGCFSVGAKLYGSIATYAALEIFGASSDITMRGCFSTDCHTGIRAGYDNDRTTEPDPPVNLIQEGNTWRNITVMLDAASTYGTSYISNGGLTEVMGVSGTPLPSDFLISTQIPIDGTVPTTSEGVEVVSTSYTSKSPNRRLKLTFCVPTMEITSSGAVVAAVFVNGTFAFAGVHRVTSGGTPPDGIMVVRTIMSSASGAAQAISVRLGPHSSATITVNPAGNNWGDNERVAPYLLIEEVP